MTVSTKHLITLMVAKSLLTFIAINFIMDETVVIFAQQALSGFQQFFQGNLNQFTDALENAFIKFSGVKWP